MKNSCIQFILALILCCPTISITAQSFPINVQVIIPKPVPVTTTEVLNRTGEPVVILTNTNNKPKELMLGAIIQGNNGILAILDPNKKKPAYPINIPAFGSVMLTGDHIIDIHENYNPNDISLKGITFEELFSNPLLPEGIYSICVKAYDFETGEQLSQDEPFGCSPPFEVKTPDPPIITYPLDQSTIEQNLINPIAFRWTPVTLPQTFLQYSLRLVEVPDGVNPYKAMNNSNFLVWEEDNLTAPIFLYDLTKPSLDLNVQYAIQVTAYDPNEEIFIKNDGKSDIVQFNLEEPLQYLSLLTPEDNAEITYDQKSNINFSWSNLINSNGVNFDFAVRFKDYDKPIENLFDDPESLILYKTDLTISNFSYSQNENVLELGRNYIWQVRAFDDFGNPITPNNGLSEIFDFSYLDAPNPAPYFTYPDEDIIIATTSENTLFQWAHDISKKNEEKITEEVQYNLKVWKSASEPTSQIMLSKDPYISLQNISGLELEHKLISENYYLALVQAISQNGEEYENNGYSEPIIFYLDRDLNDFSTLDLSCGEGGLLPEIQNQNQINEIKEGDEFRMGTFVVEVNQKFNIQGRVVGTCTIKKGNFFHSDISASFQGLSINTDGVAYRGEVIANIESELLVPESWKKPSGAILNPNEPIQSIQSLNTLSTDHDDTSEDAINLPIEFNDVFITYLKLSPREARTNLVASESLNSTILSSVYPFFGKKNVLFSSGGPAVPSESAYLRLLETTEIPRNRNTSIVLQKSVYNALNEGTIMRYDCDGKQDIAAVGYVKIQDEELMYNGENMITNPLTARFEVSFDEWEDWEADVQFIKYNRRQECCGSNQKQIVSIANNPFYEFEILIGKYDNSFTKNIEGFIHHNLNSSSSVVQNFWQGLYFPSLKVKLPEFLNSETEGDRMEIEAFNYSLSSGGLSGITDIEIDNGFQGFYLQDWKWLLKEFEMDISQNVIDISNLKGAVRVPLFEEYFDVSIESFWNGLNYDWTINTQSLNNQNISIPAWDATAILNEDSNITARLSSSRDKIYIQFDFGGTFDFEEQIGFVQNNHLQNLNFKNLTILNFFSNITIPFYDQNEMSFEIQGSDTDRIGGYFANINKIDLITVDVYDENNGDEFKVSSLQFDYDFGLDDIINGLSANGKLRIDAKPIGEKIDYFEQHVGELSGIFFDNTQIPGGKISGYLAWENTQNAQHFEGNLSGNILNYEGSIRAYVGNINDYGYWSLALNYNPGTPIVVVPGLFSSQISGGMYCNMKKVTPENNASATDIDFVRPNYQGQYDNFGITFGSVLFSGTGQDFNGKFLLDVELDTENNTLEEIILHGVGHFLNKDIGLSYWLTNNEPYPDAEIIIDGNISFNWPEKRLHGLFGYEVDYENGLVTGSSNQSGGQLEFDFNSDYWFIHCGNQTNRIFLDLNIFDDPITASSYLMVGGEFNGDITDGIGGVEFGLFGDYATKTDETVFPTSDNDYIRARAGFHIGAHGAAGWVDGYCSGHDPDNFFFFLQTEASGYASVDFWEDKDSWLRWPWMYNQPYEKWVNISWLSPSISLSGNIYGFDVFGLSGNFNFSWYKVNVNANGTLGDECN